MTPLLNLALSLLASALGFLCELLSLDPWSARWTVRAM